MKDYMHFIPGYTGFCPELPLHFGHTYGNATRHVIRHHPHIRERLGPVHYRPLNHQPTEGHPQYYCGKPAHYGERKPPANHYYCGKPCDPEREELRCNGAAAAPCTVARTCWEDGDRICCVYAVCLPKDTHTLKNGREIYPKECGRECAQKNGREIYPKECGREYVQKNVREIYPKECGREYAQKNVREIYPKECGREYAQKNTHIRKSVRKPSRCLPRECPAGPIHCPLIQAKGEVRYCPADYCREDYRARRMPRVKPHRRGGVVPKYTGHITGLQFSFGESYGPASDRLLRRHHDCMTNHHRKL